jgi:membrane associated rhomboid family serine protease
MDTIETTEGKKKTVKHIVVKKNTGNKLVWYLIAANVLVFLIVFSMPESLREAVFNNLSFSAASAGEVWRWLTSLFLHVSASHLFFNMLGLYFFGKVLERQVPRSWFLSIYFVGGLLGNLVFGGTSVGLVAGASGCIFALMGAAMLLNPVKKTHAFVIPLPLGLVAIVYVLTEVFVSYFDATLGGIAHMAHLGGLVTGAVFAFFHDTRRSLKGSIVLAVSVLLLIFLGPIFGLIIGVGAFVLSIIDAVLGLFLYNLALVFSFLWV